MISQSNVNQMPETDKADARWPDLSALRRSANCQESVVRWHAENVKATDESAGRSKSIPPK